MSTITNNLKLVKYDMSDKITPQGFNQNFDTIDNEIGEIKKDYIVSQGEVGIWSYRRWNSGFMELFGSQDITFRINEKWNWCYYDPNVKGGAEFPSVFKVAKPHGTISLVSDYGWAWLTINSNNSSTNTSTVYVVSAREYDNNKSGTLYYHYWGWVK